MITVLEATKILAQNYLTPTGLVDTSHAPYSIKGDQLSRVINLLNTALITISLEKLIFLKKILLELKDNQTDYILEEKYLKVFLTDTEPYDTFKDELFSKIIYIKDLKNNSYLFNNNRKQISLKNYKTILFNSDFLEKFKKLSDLKKSFIITYQAKHPKLENLTDVIDVPPSFYEAIYLHCSQAFYGSLGSNGLNMYNKYWNEYHTKMRVLENQNLGSTSNTPNNDDIFYEKGWV